MTADRRSAGCEAWADSSAIGRTDLRKKNHQPLWCFSILRVVFYACECPKCPVRSPMFEHGAVSLVRLHVY